MRPGRVHTGTLAWLVEGLEGSEASHRQFSSATEAADSTSYRSGERGRPPHPDDAGNVLRARSAVALLRAAAHPRPQARPALDVEDADALGPVDLVAGEGEEVHVETATSMGILPAACTASQCTRAPRARAVRTTSATGWMTPVSLLASITATSAVWSSTLAARS